MRVERRDDGAVDSRFRAQRQAVGRRLAVGGRRPIDLNVVEQHLAEQFHTLEPGLEVHAEQAVDRHAPIILHQETEVEDVGEPGLEQPVRARGDLSLPRAERRRVGRSPEQPVRDKEAVIRRARCIGPVVELRLHPLELQAACAE